MKIEFEHGTTIEKPTKAELVEELAEVGGERGAFAILSRSPQEYMQTYESFAEGKFMIEYREEGRQYKVVDPLSRKEMVDTFQDYARERSDYKERHRWKELDLDSSTRENGCFGSAALFLIFFLVATMLAV